VGAPQFEDTFTWPRRRIAVVRGYDVAVNLPATRPSSRSTWRRRATYAAACVATIILGLASRRYGGALPPFLSQYAGDTLWAAMVFFGLSLLFPHRPPWFRATAALAFSFAIEFSQLYHRPWLTDLRHTTLGGLVLGQGFLATDLLCYTAGVGLAFAVDALLIRTASHTASPRRRR
jgi:hypothetical protein